MRPAFPRVELRPLEGPREVARVALARVEDHEHGLSCQEAEALDVLLFLDVNVEPAQRLALLEGRLEAHDEVLLGLELRRLLLRDVLLDAIEPVRDDREVREEHLRLEELEVARRVDRALGVRYRVGGEAANDDRESVHLPQLGKVQALRAALRDARHIHEFHRRRRVLLRFEHRRERVEPGVGDLRDADVRFALARRRRRLMAGQEREERGLAGELESEDAEFHDGILLPTGKLWPFGPAC